MLPYNPSLSVSCLLVPHVCNNCSQCCLLQAMEKINLGLCYEWIFRIRKMWGILESSGLVISWLNYFLICQLFLMRRAQCLSYTVHWSMPKHSAGWLPRTVQFEQWCLPLSRKGMTDSFHWIHTKTFMQVFPAVSSCASVTWWSSSSLPTRLSV